MFITFKIYVYLYINHMSYLLINVKLYKKTEKVNKSQIFIKDKCLSEH